MRWEEKNIFVLRAILNQGIHILGDLREEVIYTSLPFKSPYFARENNVVEELEVIFFEVPTSPIRLAKNKEKFQSISLNCCWFNHFELPASTSVVADNDEQWRWCSKLPELWLAYA